MSKETVLVVDDEEHARNAVSRLLTANGYSVQVLASGEEAIEYATAHTFDVLLCDFRMPGLDGLTTTRAVRKINPQVVAIIMTGNTSIDLAVQSLNLGVHGFVVKPFHGYELLNTIERTIERQSLIRENIKMKALMQVFEATEALITSDHTHTGTDNEKQLLGLTLEFTLRETQANEVALFLLDKNQQLNLVGTAYKDSDLRVFVPPDYTADDWTFLEKKVYQALDGGTLLQVGADQPLELEQGLADQSQTETALVLLPMQVQGRKIGVLCLRRQDTDASFTEVELQAAVILVGQAAIAIDNARMFRQLVHIEALREADRLRSEFVSTVSHELRTPLTSIKGYATTLLRPDVKWGDVVGHEYLEIISEECDKLMGLIDNILEVSKIEAGVLRIYPEPMQLLETVEYVVTEAERRSPQVQIELKAPEREQLPLVLADHQRITQVLRNLLSNAVKYSGNPVKIVIEISQSYLYNKSKQLMIRVDVHDNGFGISHEHILQVFERFYRVDVGMARKTEGTGLGLAICKGIIEAHGGEIWVESAGPGQGSTFSFTLPVANE